MKGQNLIVVRAWIEKADHDLGSARVIFQHIPEYSDTIAFHCQQAVEK
jgi:HEPN domain-containing protein